MQLYMHAYRIVRGETRYLVVDWPSRKKNDPDIEMAGCPLVGSD